MISQRLAQQGEVWWSVFRQMNEGLLSTGDLTSEILALVSPATQSFYDFGQWKMMKVACGYSAYSIYRIEAGNPFTATTTASLLYYFGYFGAAVFYLLIGCVYSSLVGNASLAFSERRCLESMVYVKLISVFGNILFASDLTYLVSLQGAVYLTALIVLTINREVRHKRIKNKLNSNSLYFLDWKDRF